MSAARPTLPPSRPVPAQTVRPAPPPCAARRPRCRRCRTPAVGCAPEGHPTSPAPPASRARGSDASARAVRWPARRPGQRRAPHPALPSLIPLRPIPIRLHVRREFLGGELQRLVHLRFHVDLNRIVLPRRMAFPVVPHQDAAQVGMALESGPDKVVDLPLPPLPRL